MCQICKKNFTLRHINDFLEKFAKINLIVLFYIIEIFSKGYSATQTHQEVLNQSLEITFFSVDKIFNEFRRRISEYLIRKTKCSDLNR